LGPSSLDLDFGREDPTVLKSLYERSDPVRERSLLYQQSCRNALYKAVVPPFNVWRPDSLGLSV
jgi:hypothetical protein